MCPDRGCRPVGVARRQRYLAECLGPQGDLDVRGRAEFHSQRVHGEAARSWHRIATWDLACGAAALPCFHRSGAAGVRQFAPGYGGPLRRPTRPPCQSLVSVPWLHGGTEWLGSDGHRLERIDSQDRSRAQMADVLQRTFHMRDLDRMLSFASANAFAQQDFVYLRPGDIVWRLPLERLISRATSGRGAVLAGSGQTPADGRSTLEELRLWFDRDGLAGYVWADPPTDFELDLRTGLAWEADVATAMLDWIMQVRSQWRPAYPWLVDLENMTQWAEALTSSSQSRPGRWLTIPACETDTRRIDALVRRGFIPTDHHAVLYARSLADLLPTPKLQSGFRIRHVTERDVAARVAVHRAAWPGSSWSAERYGALRASAGYDESLDLVCEDSSGRLAACCICWADSVSRTGHFEPMGADPAYRGLGLARALVHEGFRRLKAAGMVTAYTETPSFNAPAQALYSGSGFDAAGKRRTFLKRLG